jgi:hypothetical protein
MSLEVKDYTERKKIYKFECGEFTLRPPYMYLVEKVQPLAIELDKLEKSRTKSEDGLAEFKKILNIFVKILKLILEETENSTVENIKPDTLRIDIAKDIIKDFFLQFKI